MVLQLLAAERARALSVNMSTHIDLLELMCEKDAAVEQAALFDWSWLEHQHAQFSRRCSGPPSTRYQGRQTRRDRCSAPVARVAARPPKRWLARLMHGHSRMNERTATRWRIAPETGMRLVEAARHGDKWSRPRMAGYHAGRGDPRRRGRAAAAAAAPLRQPRLARHRRPSHRAAAAVAQG